VAVVTLPLAVDPVKLTGVPEASASTAAPNAFADEAAEAAARFPSMWLEVTTRGALDSCSMPPPNASAAVPKATGPVDRAAASFELTVEFTSVSGPLERIPPPNAYTTPSPVLDASARLSTTEEDLRVIDPPVEEMPPPLAIVGPIATLSWTVTARNESAPPAWEIPPPFGLEPPVIIRSIKWTVGVPEIVRVDPRP